MAEASRYWRSREVADTYRRLWASRTAPAARDLVGLADPPEGGLILDVGTGTGVCADAARDLVGGRGLVVATDDSVEMLAVTPGSRRGLVPAVADAADLPFPDATFDVVMAGFVVGWLANHERALSEMTRVLRPLGRLALSWHGESNAETLPDYSAAWWDLLLTVTDETALEDVVKLAIPSDEYFADPATMEAMLHRQGLDPVSVEGRQYMFECSIEEFVDAQANGPDGRFVREKLGSAEWKRFRSTARRALRNMFNEPLQGVEVALLGVGTKH